MQAKSLETINSMKTIRRGQQVLLGFPDSSKKNDGIAADVLEVDESGFTFWVMTGCWPGRFDFKAGEIIHLHSGRTRARCSEILAVSEQDRDQYQMGNSIRILRPSDPAGIGIEPGKLERVRRISASSILIPDADGNSVEETCSNPGFHDDLNSYIDGPRDVSDFRELIENLKISIGGHDMSMEALGLEFEIHRIVEHYADSPRSPADFNTAYGAIEDVIKHWSPPHVTIRPNVMKTSIDYVAGFEWAPYPGRYCFPPDDDDDKIYLDAPAGTGQSRARAIIDLYTNAMNDPEWCIRHFNEFDLVDEQHSMEMSYCAPGVQDIHARMMKHIAEIARIAGIDMEWEMESMDANPVDNCPDELDPIP